MVKKACFYTLCLLLGGVLLSACRPGPVTPTLTPTATMPPAPTLQPTTPPTAVSTATPIATNPPPATATPLATATVPPTITPTPTPAFPVYDGPPLAREQIGVQIHLHNEDLDEMMRQLSDLNVGWVKVQVSWKLFQPEPGRLDDVLWQELDDLVAAANERDIQVLLGVAKAPEWSRPTTEMDGPPSDYATFGRFMSLLASRYAGRVAAYELWNETNLQREWNGAPLSGADLAEIIRIGAQAVREYDPQAQIITGAPAPTGINDGITAVDDRVYFQQMVDAGVAQWVDGFGVHPYGWANPPLSSAENPDPAVPTHADHPSFFFRDTLRDYGQILAQAGVDKPLWATEFGWGSYENIADTAVAGTEYMNNVTEWQQAEYTLGAYAFVRERNEASPNDFGPFILWNLNFGPLLGTEFSESAYSILRPDGSPRPVYGALRTLTGNE